MKLTVSTISETSEDIPRDLTDVIRALRQCEEPFFILEKSAGNFLQGAWNEPHGYYLEYYQSGVPGHHNSQRNVPVETVCELVNRYRSSDASWRDLCEWRHIPPPEEDDDGRDVCLGTLEGVALRHLLTDLERNGVPCRLEPQEAQFNVFVPAEFGDDARAIVRSLFPL